MQRILTRILLVVAMAWAPAALSVATELSGNYLGVADADGAVINIRPDDDGYRGTFFDARGARQNFEADRAGDAAEAVLDMDQRTVLMRMTPLPYGAEVAIIPFLGDGRLDIASGRVLNFVREGLEIPAPPADFVPAPVDADGRITANSFLASYEFWSPSGVKNGYLSLPARFRTVLRLFPLVQLDVIWKLCLAPDADRALAIALRGQGVSCTEVLDGLAELQETGAFKTFKRDVAQDRAVLRTSVRCADRYVESKDACERAARRLSASAISLETAATAMARYR